MMASGRRTTLGLVTVVAAGISIIGYIPGCAARERNPATTTAITSSSGEALDAGESHVEALVRGRPAGAAPLPPHPRNTPARAGTT